MEAGQKALIRRELRALKIPVWEMKIDQYEMAFHQPRQAGSRAPPHKRIKLKKS
jgi:hypothetical protein